MKEAKILKKIKLYITPEQTTILKKIDSLTYLKDFEPNSIIKEGRIYKSTIHDGDIGKVIRRLFRNNTYT